LIFLDIIHVAQHRISLTSIEPNSNTTRLEEKLSSLVELLKASGDVPSILSSPSDISTKAPGSQYRPVINTPLESNQSRENYLILDYQSNGYKYAPPTCICQATVGEDDLLPVDSDENLLSIYMRQVCSFFPFVIISPGTTAAELQATRPFLMKAVRLVASLRSLRSMWGQNQSIMQYISDAVLLKSERSLDLVQGILVLLGYYHYHCLVHMQFGNLMQLAIGMVGDMDLHRERTRVLSTDPDRFQARTNDERRAIVGTWYMSSK